MPILMKSINLFKLTLKYIFEKKEFRDSCKKCKYDQKFWKDNLKLITIKIHFDTLP